MATCTVTTIPPPPPPPVEKKYILELTELEASALRQLVGSQICYPASQAGKAIHEVFEALHAAAVGGKGRFVISGNGYKIFD